MARAMKTSQVPQNVISRQFRSCAPRKALLTDITYLFYRGSVCYLSHILDVFSREVTWKSNYFSAITSNFDLMRESAKACTFRPVTS